MSASNKKIEIAAEYLRDSIALYKNARYFSALTLAGASEEVLGKAIEQLPPVAAGELANRSALNAEIKAHLQSYEFFGSSPQTEKQIRDRILKPRNSAKHYDSVKDDTINFDPQYEAGKLILFAINNYRLVFPDVFEHFGYEEEDIRVHQLQKLLTERPIADVLAEILAHAHER